jgi:hypothetical protein
MLFQSAHNPRTASFLIATAVKLVHSLQLHRKSARETFDTDSDLERRHVFWITYILDKDINLRAHEPYLLQDKNIDMELPGYYNADDKAGSLIVPIWLNLFSPGFI